MFRFYLLIFIVFRVGFCEFLESPTELPLAILFDKNSAINLDKYAENAIKYVNNELKPFGLKMTFQLVIVDMSNSHQLITNICQQMSRGVLALFGPISMESSNALKIFTDSYHLPYITWSSLPAAIEDTYNAEYKQQAENQNHLNTKPKDINAYQISMRPDISPLLIYLIKLTRWPKIYYLYNNDYAVARISAIMKYQTEELEFMTDLLMRKINNVNQSIDILRNIASSDYAKTELSIAMMVDLNTKEDYMSFFMQVKNLGMTQMRYHYIVVSLNMHELDLNDFQYGGSNITGFTLVDEESHETIRLLDNILDRRENPKKLITTPHEALLLIDSILLFGKRITEIIIKNQVFGRKFISMENLTISLSEIQGYNCTYDNGTYQWPLGPVVYKSLIKTTVVDGITGKLAIDSKGYRTNYTIRIFRIAFQVPLKKIGIFYSNENSGGLRIDASQFLNKPDVGHASSSTKKRIIVSILDPPFLMLRNESGKNFTGNDRFVGYSVDLAQKISEILKFDYEFRLVKDGKFGVKEESGHWNGMVGELIRHEADLCIAPLTISSIRERAVEFSKPFMNIGISIMIKKPKQEKPGVFSFMSPLSTKVWICIVWAHIGVSLVLFLVRSTAGRLVASVWWFFTLILISSYTANLAAFLTIERMVAPIESAEDLAKQTEIKYGSVDSGSTKQFFQTSNLQIYQKMWDFMKSNGPSVFVKDNKEGVKKVRDSQGKYAFLLESVVNEYLNERAPCDTMKVGHNLDSKGYGIATPVGSDLKESINLAVLQLLENGFLEELKKKWWIDGSECGAQTKDSSGQNPLNLINVAGVFYILILGLILSLFIAMCEVLHKARIESKKNKIKYCAAIKSKIRLSISGYDDTVSTRRRAIGHSETKHTILNGSVLDDSSVLLGRTENETSQTHNLDADGKKSIDCKYEGTQV